MSFSRDVKKEICRKYSGEFEDFTFPPNTNIINPSLTLAWVFFQKGSVNDPETSYHLELVFENEAEAAFVLELMEKQGFRVRITKRKEKYIVYLKDRETIAAVSYFTGAVGAMMRMENSLILKDMRNSVNRRVNFETANIERTVGAAVKDIEAIEFIEKHGGLKQLPENLREIAKLRVENPDVSLKSLGESMDPPLGKSGVNHRLRKIREAADRLRNC